MHLERQQLIIITISLTLVVGFITLQGYPYVRQLSHLRQARAEGLAQTEEVQSKQDQMPQLLEQLKKDKAVLREFNRVVPVEQGFGQLWQEIANAMNRYDLDNQQVRPSQEKRGGELVCVPLTIECSGKLSQIHGFLQTLQNMDRLIRIEYFHLENNGQLEGSLQVQIRANVYYQNAKSQGGQSV